MSTKRRRGAVAITDPTILPMSPSETYLRAVILDEDRTSNPRAIAMRALQVCGIPHVEIAEGNCPRFQWDGSVMTIPRRFLAVDILHELCHWLVASPERRSIPEFGLGPGFNCGDETAAIGARVLAPDRASQEEIVTCLIAAKLAYLLGIANMQNLVNEEFIANEKPDPVDSAAWGMLNERRDLFEAVEQIAEATSNS